MRPSPSFSERQVRNIRARYRPMVRFERRNWRQHRLLERSNATEIARDFGVNVRTIYRVVKPGYLPSERGR